MGIQLGSNFDLNASLPLDSRDVVADVTARDAIVSRYDGMKVYVQSEKKVFQLQDGTTNSDWVDITGNGAALTELILEDWTATTDYVTNELVYNNGKIYRAITGFTSGATFDEVNWTLVADKDTKALAPDWTATTVYAANEIVVESGVLYRAVVDFTSGATFDEANWEAIGATGGGAGDLNTYYNETFEDFTDGSEFPCLDGGTIGAGSPITSFVSIETADPLNGEQSIKFTIPASGTGKYCLLDSSLQIPVPKFAQNGKSSFTFVADGTANYGDISLFLWDTTNAETIKDKDGNTLFINPRANIGNTLYFNTNGTQALQWGAFINRDNTGATLVIDNVSIQGNPDKNISVYASSDWESYTPTITGFGTVTNLVASWREDGPDMLVEGRFTAGTVSSVDASVSLPNNELIRQINGASTEVIGTYTRGSTSTFNSGKMLKYITGSDSVVYFGQTQSQSSNSENPLDIAQGTDIGGGSSISFEFRVPIKGWSDKEDNVIVAGTNDKLAYVEARGNGGETVTANITNIPFSTVDNDKGLWDGSEFTADRDMAIFATGMVLFSGSASTGLRSYISGVASKYVSYDVNQDAFIFTVTEKLKAGQRFSIRSSNTRDLVNSSEYHHLTIQELPSEDLIYAYLDESRVGASYNSSTAQSIGSSGTQIIYENKEYDSEDFSESGYGYDVSTGEYIVPVSGLYSIEAAFSADSSGTTEMGYYIEIVKNGTAIRRKLNTSQYTTGTEAKKTAYLTKGNVITIKGKRDTSANLLDNSVYNTFSIYRIR